MDKFNEQKDQEKIKKNKTIYLYIVLGVLALLAVAGLIYYTVIQMNYNKYAKGKEMDKILAEKGINGLKTYPYGIQTTND